MEKGNQPMWAHQKDLIEKALTLDNYALFWDPGVGKSRGIIELLRQKFKQEGGLFNTLILCPTVVCENWRDEWAKFSKVPDEEVEVLRGSGKYRTQRAKVTKARILITNYQALLMEDLVTALKVWRPVCIIADESHRLKSAGAKTTKKAIELSLKAKYKYILTGTPILNNLMDFYSQFKFLDGGETFGNSFSFFKNFYFYNKNANAPSHVTWPDWVLRPSAEHEVKEKVFKKAMYVEKSKCLDLPPFVRKKIEVGLSPEQLKHYKQMEREFVTYINDQACSASIALTKGLRLMQILSGFIKTEDGKEIRFKDTPRIEALREILADIAPYHKVIVWACFKENYTMIKEVCAKLKLDFVELHGGTKDRAGAIHSFQTDERVRVLIGNAGAGGIGVNLTAASYAVYYSRSFSLEHDVQSEARNYRGGSDIHQKITRIDLVCKGSLDEHVLEALSTKQDISDAVLKTISAKL